jgi:hypothetical protein
LKLALSQWLDFSFAWWLVDYTAPGDRQLKKKMNLLCDMAKFVSSIGNSTTSIPRLAFLSFLSILLLVVHFPNSSLDHSEPVACDDFVEENAGLCGGATEVPQQNGNRKLSVITTNWGFQN